MTSRPRHHSRTPQVTLRLSKSDYASLYRAQAQAYEHSSGGSFNVVATWRKGGCHSVGKNLLARRGITLFSHYPSEQGVHAESDLVSRGLVASGTVYVAGAHERSGTQLATTRPCRHCVTVLHEARVRFACYFADNKPTKARIADLL